MRKRLSLWVPCHASSSPVVTMCSSHFLLLWKYTMSSSDLWKKNYSSFPFQWWSWLGSRCRRHADHISPDTGNGVREGSGVAINSPNQPRGCTSFCKVLSREGHITFLNSATSWGPGVQTHDPVEDFSHAPHPTLWAKDWINGLMAIKCSLRSAHRFWG